MLRHGNQPPQPNQKSEATYTHLHMIRSAKALGVSRNRFLWRAAEACAATVQASDSAFRLLQVGWSHTTNHVAVHGHVLGTPNEKTSAESMSCGIDAE